MQSFIVATDTGIFYKMQQAAPEKSFLAAPTAGEGATCRSCAHCPWMAMNELENLGSHRASLKEILEVLKETKQYRPIGLDTFFDEDDFMMNIDGEQ